MKKIRVLIVDDHPVFREGLCKVLAIQEDIDVIAQAGTADEAFPLIKELIPDIAIIDVSLPKTDGITLAKQVKSALPSVLILMLSAYDYEAYVVSSLQVGASGYLLKDTSPREIVGAVRAVYSGEAVFEMKAVSQVLKRLVSNGTVDKKSSNQLHKRELEVLRLAARGKTNKEIAVELGISERTVQAHIMNVYRKLEVNSRTGAMLRALREGWLTLDDLNVK